MDKEIGKRLILMTRLFNKYSICYDQIGVFSYLQWFTGWQSLLIPLCQWLRSAVCPTTRTRFVLSSTWMVSLSGNSESSLKINIQSFEILRNCVFGSYYFNSACYQLLFLRRGLRQRFPCGRVDLMGCDWLERPGLWAHPVGGVTGLHSGWNTINCSQTQWDVHSAPDHQWKGEEEWMYLLCIRKNSYYVVLLL